MTDIPDRSPRWTIPETVYDIDSLNRWLEGLPIKQVDTKTHHDGLVVFSWIGSAEEDAVREIIRQLAFMLMGFLAANPNGVMWRIRPELEWRRLDQSGFISAPVVYVRLGPIEDSLMTDLPRPDVQVSTGTGGGESEASIVVTPAGGKSLSYTGKGPSMNEAVKKTVERMLDDPKIIEALPAKRKES